MKRARLESNPFFAIDGTPGEAAVDAGDNLRKYVLAKYSSGLLGENLVTDCWIGAALVRG
jgi:hypothetical protein